MIKDIESKPNNKSLLFVLLSIFVLISILAIFYFKPLKLLVFKAPITVLAKTNDGKEIKEKFYFNEQIKFNNINYAIINEANNTLVFTSDLDIKLEKSKNIVEITVNNGSVYISLKESRKITLDKREVLFEKDIDSFYNSSNHTLSIISGNLEYKNTKYTKNQLIHLDSKNENDFNFDRSLYTSDAIYKKLYDTLKILNLLPPSLQDINQPTLGNINPENNTEIKADKINLKGNTKPNIKIKINNNELTSNDKGDFESTIDLKIGDNNITIILEDNFGNKNKIIVNYKRIDECAGVTDCGKCGNPSCQSQAKTNPEKLNTNNSSDQTTTSEFLCSTSFNTELLNLINNYRNSNGKNSLTLENKINIAACNHSKWMSDTGNFSHTGNNGSAFYERCEAAGTSCDGENLAYGTTSASAVFEMWKASPPHNANILGDHSVMGVGLFGVYTTADFR